MLRRLRRTLRLHALLRAAPRLAAGRRPDGARLREAASYVLAHEDKGTLVVSCDAAGLDYYLDGETSGKGDSMQACEAKDVPKVASRIKEKHYTRVMHLISQPEPDQRMISTLQGAIQPVAYERFDGAAVVTYKVRQHPSAGPPQPKPPSGLPKEG